MLVPLATVWKSYDHWKCEFNMYWTSTQRGYLFNAGGAWGRLGTLVSTKFLDFLTMFLS